MDLVLFQPASLMAAEATSPGPVSVILWFDTEDYLLPAADDALLRLAQILTDRGIQGTFKMVGEKARVLERRGRQDVIAALKKHAIAYHTDYHSVHPTPTEYLAECGWLDGIAEFVRRESAGSADVRRIFGVPTLACYGQPGSSWAPQAIAALGAICVSVNGIPCYVDDGNHVGLNHRPFWYAGALNVYNLGENCTRMELFTPAAVEPAKSTVLGIVQRLQKGPPGGLVSIYYHPCEWVHMEFWDGVNFRRGANPPREQWQAPPQRPAEETEQAFQRFAGYVDYIKNIPGARFITASDLPASYPDLTRIQGAPKADVRSIALNLANPEAKAVDYLVLGDRAYSVADQFELLTLAITSYIQIKSVAWPLRTQGMLGPDQVASRSKDGAANAEVVWTAFRDATLDTCDYLQKQKRVPARIYLGAKSVAPADFLVGLAQTYLQIATADKSRVPEKVKLGQQVELLSARFVAEDTPSLFGEWIIHPEGFRAPKLMEQARLQAWTLKPAIGKNN
jgi:hypothetical protein